MPSDRAIGTVERACFEVGIKFGSLYHQFAGTPIDPESAAVIASAMAASIENQPYCREVTVEMDESAITEAIAESSSSYVELSGRFYQATIVVAVEEWVVRARMQMEDGYPLMALNAIERR